MATFFEMQKAALKRMDQVATIAEEFGFNTISELVVEKMKEMVHKQLVVVVAGEVKRGKSALLNALLNEKKPVCPVDADVCTNAVTVVRYGDEECIRVFILDKNAENEVRVEIITRDEIADYVSEANNPGNYRNVIRIDVELKNDLLKEGVVFVDTPGVGSLNIEHAEVTLGFLPNADMLLFVTDTASVISETELEFLKRGYKYCDCIVYPLTKMDLDAEYDVLLNSNKKKISQALQIPEDEVQMIPVSSKNKERYLKKPEREDYYINSNYPLLEETIWTTIARRQAEIRILPYLNEAENQLRKIMDSLVGQYQVLGDEKASETLLVELRNKEAEINKLSQDGADWKLKLQMYFSNIQMDITNIRDDISQKSRTLVEEAIAQKQTKICKKDEFNKLLSDINDKMIQGTLEIRKLLEEGIDEQIDDIQKSIGLNVSNNQDILNRMNYKPKTDVTVNFPTKKMGTKMVDKGRKIGGGSFGGGSIGAVFGGFLGAAVGAAAGFFTAGPAGAYALGVEGSQIGAAAGGAIGGGIGGAVGVAKALDKYDMEDISHVRSALNQHINSSMTCLSNVMNTVSRQLQAGIIHSFDNNLKQQIKLLQDNRKTIQKNLDVMIHDIPIKRKELKAQIDKTTLLLDKVTNLQTKIGDLQLSTVTSNQNSANSGKNKNGKQKTIDYGFM